MGRVAHHQVSSGQMARHRLVRLRTERQKLASKINRLDAEIGKLERKNGSTKLLKSADLSKLLDQLVEGLPNLPPLPRDFSRADLYEDHD